jgi:Alginate export
MKALRICTLAGLISATYASAQYVPPPPPRPFPGFVNEKLRADDPYMNAWDIGVNVRVRGEDKEEAGATDAGSNWDFSERPQDDNQNQYLLTRVMPRVGYTAKWFNFLVEARSSYSYGDERFNATAPGQGLTDRDGPIDLHQAYLMIGNHKEFPVSVKLGRQELVYGDQRLVGHFRWGNNARTFDAVKVRWQNAIFGVDLFSGGVVYTDHNNFNRANSQDVFSGACFNFPTLAKKEIVEGYFLARNVNRGIATDDWRGVAAPFRFPGAQDIYTAGVRIKSKPNAYGPWDYGLEAIYQFGNRAAVAPAATVAAALAAPRLDHRAYALVAQGGYTFADAWGTPRLALIYSYGSGDKNAADSKSGTFQNLFPTNHLFYGYMDLSSLQNMHDIRLAYTLKPMPTLSLALEGHLHYLDRTTDYWYNVAGVPRNFAGAAVDSGAGYRINPSYSNKVGSEIDFVAGWSVTHYAQIEVGLCHYFRGDYIKESLRAVGSHDANYAYLQVTLNL